MNKYRWAKTKLILLLILSFTSSSSWAERVHYSVSDPAILYNFKDSNGTAKEMLIHPGCFKELATELNGDNIAASVNLSRADIRSCMDSNRYYTDAFVKDGWVRTKPYPTDENERIKDLTIGYKHLKNLGGGFHIIGYYEEVDGSMGESRSILLVQFKQKKIVEVNEENKPLVILVDTIERVGRISEKANIDALDKSSILKLIQ